MRARGAEATDIVVLVVAADDGVMPQTIEAINHAKAADVPIVVAVNKIDKDNADPQRVLPQLAEHGLVPESWGGDTIVVEMSALQDLGIDDLLEQLLVVAELEELTANPDGRAKGVVLEANLDIGRGPVATVLVDKGTLKVGDPIVAGAAWGRVRALIDDKGEQVKEAGPSTPVQVLGLSDVPERRRRVPRRPRREDGPHRRRGPRAAAAPDSAQRGDARVQTGVKLEDIFSQIQAGEAATLNLILKADVHGSLEARHREPAQARARRGQAGVRPPRRRWHHRERHQAGRRPPTPRSSASTCVPTARPASWPRPRTSRSAPTRSSTSCSRTSSRPWSACSRRSSKRSSPARPRSARSSGCPRIGAIAGCYVRNGVDHPRLQGPLPPRGHDHLEGRDPRRCKRFKDDVREVREGFECGIGLSDFQDLKPGDIIETFEEREIARV